MLKELLTLIYSDEFSELVKDKDGWKSMYIDYHKPFVERLYRDLDDGNRVYIHRIHGCSLGESLLHPHPWPAAFHIVSGEYLTGLVDEEAISDRDELPKNLTWVGLTRGSIYEMSRKSMWHCVAPSPGTSCITIMLTGEPWDRDIPFKPEKEFRELTAEEKDKLFSEFAVNFGW